MKTMGFCALSLLFSMAAYGGISAARSAAGRPLPQTAVSPSSAATSPSLDTPAGGAARDTPPGRPRNPNSTPMPAPAPTNHYAGLVGNTDRIGLKLTARAGYDPHAGMFE